MLYTAKGVASILVPVASLIAAHYGWYAVFMITVSLNVVAASLALFVLKPIRTALLAEVSATAGIHTSTTVTKHEPPRGARREPAAFHQM
jgi:OFA family oxalate/formate antiporter-like MFS transporter